MTVLLMLACRPAIPGEEPAIPTVIRLTDAEQVQYEAEVEPALLEMDVGEEVRIDWSGLAEDVYGRPLGETPVSEAWIFAPSQAEVGLLMHDMVNEQLQMEALSVFATCVGLAAACDLRDFRLLDGAADLPERLAASGVAWGLVLVNPVDGGLAGVYELAAGGPGSLVDVQISATAPISVSVDRGVAATGVPAAEPAIRVDWSAVTVTGTGDAWKAAEADELFVIRSTLDADALAGSLFDLASVSESRWTMPIAGQQVADLSELEGDEPFPGFDASGTWMLGLSCVGCGTPAPRLLTLVEVAP